MKNVHPEFSFQSRELEGQIEGTLGDPPNRKNYDMMVGALVSEYADGGGIDDVNMMAFALVDKIRFLDAKGLMGEALDYADGDPAKVFAMAECTGDDGTHKVRRRCVARRRGILVVAHEIVLGG